jgi:hypothetical protein
MSAREGAPLASGGHGERLAPCHRTRLWATWRRRQCLVGRVPQRASAPTGHRSEGNPS